MRSISRVCDVSFNTVVKLLEDAGEFCARFRDANICNVKAKRVQCDEIWSFTYAKEKNVGTAKAAPDGAGDTWTWTGITADTKLIVSYFVGKRDGQCAKWFMDDVASRLATRVQLTTDGLKSYLDAVEGAFWGGRGLCAACEALWQLAGKRQGPLQPRRMHRNHQNAD